MKSPNMRTVHATTLATKQYSDWTYWESGVAVTFEDSTGALHPLRQPAQARAAVPPA